LVITVDNVAVVKVRKTLTAVVGTALSDPVTTKDGFPTPGLSASGLPNGLTLDDNGDGTATVAGTPGPGSGGSYPVVVSASNSAGTATADLNLVVDQAPGFASSTATASGTVGTALTAVPVSFSGYPAPKLRVEGLTKAKGLAFNATGLLAGTISGTPTTAGTFTVDLTATNHAGTSTEVLTLTIAS
jgi:hypothetical protein